MAEAVIKGKFRIVREIGKGGMGTVYEAIHVGLGSRCAIKQLRPDLEANQEVARRFRREARTMAKLQHPSIVRVIDIDSEPGFGSFLVMDLIHGKDLGTILFEEGRHLPLAEIVRIGAQVASALGHAHGQGVVHRDIKPANILIRDDTGAAVVTDFGIAKQLRAEAGEETTRFTETDVYLGTVRYSAPEQIRNESVDGRVDLYSLGAVLYEMLSCRRFLDGLEPMEMMAKVAFVPEWRAELVYPESAPESLRRLIEVCLERDRESRIGTARELEARLVACVPGAAAERQEVTRHADETVAWQPVRNDAVGPARSQARPVPRRRTAVLVAAAAVAACVAAALSWFIWKGEGTQPSYARIAAVEPQAERVAVQENSRRRFAVSVAGSGGDAVPVAWTLDGAEVARGVTEFTYAPDFDAAREQPYIIGARVEGGEKEGQSRAWTVDVENVNRAPTLVRVEPPAGGERAVARGQVETFQVEAEDADGDAYELVWIADGKELPETGNTLRRTVSKNEDVRLEVRDGNGGVASAAWRLVAVDKPLELDHRPASLAELPFGRAQEFALIAPPGTGPLEYRWTLDGKAVAGGDRFRFSNDDPKLVRGAAVTILATATSKENPPRRFTHQWQVQIQPPRAPEIVRSNPAAGENVVAAPGRPRVFEVWGKAAADEQQLTYVYSVGDAAERSAIGRYEFIPPEAGRYEIAAHVEDDFGQKSEQLSWVVEARNLDGAVDQWLSELEKAYNSKDLARLSAMMRLAPAQEQRLQSLLEFQEQLRVTIKERRIQADGADRALASYTRVDDFVDAKTGQRTTQSTQVQQHFRVKEGRAELVP